MNLNIEQSYKFDIIRDSFVSIYRAMKLLESTTVKNDLSIVDQRIKYLDLLDRYKLYKFNEDLYETKIPEEISKIFKHFDEYDRFIKAYFDFMLRRDKYVAEEYGYLSKSLLKRCAGCNEMNECVEIFTSRILPIFTPDLINNNRKIEDLFRKYHKDIISFIETYFYNDAKHYGWQDNIHKKRVVNAYLTAEMLEYIFSWNETECIIKLEIKQGLNYNESLYKKCIESIRDLQINNIEKAKNTLYSAGIGKQNIYVSEFLMKTEGGWFGKYIHDTWHIKVREAASIAFILNKIDKNNPICKEVIKKTKDFVDANFDGRDFLIDYSHGVDYVKYDPDYKLLQFSDIIGTIEATNFCIEICPELEDDIFKKIRWIIDRQLPTGGWPIASKDLLYKSGFLNPKNPNQENESILNTVSAVKVITNFLLKLFYVENQTEKKNNRRFL